MPTLKPVHTLDGRIRHIDPERSDRLELTIAVRIDLEPFNKMVGERIGRHPWGISVYRDGGFWFAHLLESGFEQGPGYWFELTAEEVKAWRQATRTDDLAEAEPPPSPARRRAERNALIRQWRAEGHTLAVIEAEVERLFPDRKVKVPGIRAILKSRKVKPQDPEKGTKGH